jgi:hypothetical protein
MHKSKYIVSMLAIIITSLVLIAFNKDEQTALAPGTPGAYFLLAADSSNPENVPIEGCGTEFLTRVEATNDLESTLQELFAIKDPLKSALSLSDIQVSVIDQTVNLEGELMSAGTCDVPRIKNQIELTVETFASEDQEFNITLNGSESAYKCFGDESGLCS